MKDESAARDHASGGINTAVLTRTPFNGKGERSEARSGGTGSGDLQSPTA